MATQHVRPQFRLVFEAPVKQALAVNRNVYAKRKSLL